jgi:hypothetical protein
VSAFSVRHSVSTASNITNAEFPNIYIVLLLGEYQVEIYAGDMNFGADRSICQWKAIYLIAVPRKYICGCIGASMLRNIYAVFDRTNNTPKLGVVNMPFGLV